MIKSLVPFLALAHGDLSSLLTLTTLPTPFQGESNQQLIEANVLQSTSIKNREKFLLTIYIILLTPAS